MNDARRAGVHRSLLSLLRIFGLALAIFAAGCGATLYSPRPHRFESPANVAQETHRIAQRMSQGGQRVFADPAAGTVYTPWRLGGATASATLFPPGERHGWRVHRYRVSVRPNKWASSVLVDRETFDCRAGAFTWTELELHGDCVRIEEMTAADLGELDRFGESLRG